MNAALHFASLLPRPVQRRLVGRARADLEASLRRRFEGDLAALLNRAQRDALELLARALGAPADGLIGSLRSRLWRLGAALEAGGEAELGAPWQPVPAVLGGRLVAFGPVRGLAAPVAALPRPI